MFTVALILLAVGVPAAILGPRLVSRGLEGYREAKHLRQREFVEAPETWIRPWLVNKIEVMMAADQPHEWRPVDFRYGPCAGENVSQLPTEKLQRAIFSACAALQKTQMKYAESCAVTDSCSLPEQARVELLQVERDLDQAFEGALFGGPVTYEQTTQ